jgi:50S ribosomal protein L16 3-hydroxylase
MGRVITGTLSTDAFLRRYWQRRPLLIKGAFSSFKDPISPEELAGLACEAEVDARLVFTRKATWELQSGPFHARDFTALPDRNWTLLVQAVDQWVPEVRDMLKSVAFLPNWRVDDVMISYATPNGGVGPHFDYYDVFLLQGQGSRIWKTGQKCTERDLLRTGSGLKLLKEFHTEHEWLLEPGDVLYVPPGIAHWGVSRDNSICYSLGFRAPSLGDMLLGYGEFLAERTAADQRFTDPVRRQPLRSGEIDSASLQRAQRMVRQALADSAAFNRWFGCQMTEPKNTALIEALPTPPELRKGNFMLELNPASRLAWETQGKQLLVFADGTCIETLRSARLLKLVQILAQPGARIASSTYRHQAGPRELLGALLRQGTLLATKAARQKRKSR